MTNVSSNEKLSSLLRSFAYVASVFCATFSLLACQNEIQSIHRQIGDVIYKETVIATMPKLPQGQDAELDPFVATFESLLGRPVEIPIRLGEVAGKISEATTKGVCIKHADSGYRGVVIDRTYYETHIKSEPEKVEWLVFHELGHCVLGRSHSSEKVTLKNNEVGKLSIMDTYILNTREVPIYQDNKQYYWDELFSNRTGA